MSGPPASTSEKAHLLPCLAVGSRLPSPPASRCPGQTPCCLHQTVLLGVTAGPRMVTGAFCLKGQRHHCEHPLITVPPGELRPRHRGRSESEGEGGEGRDRFKGWVSPSLPGGPRSVRGTQGGRAPRLTGGSRDARSGVVPSPEEDRLLGLRVRKWGGPSWWQDQQEQRRALLVHSGQMAIITTSHPLPVTPHVAKNMDTLPLQSQTAPPPNQIHQTLAGKRRSYTHTAAPRTLQCQARHTHNLPGPKQRVPAPSFTDEQLQPREVQEHARRIFIKSVRFQRSKVPSMERPGPYRTMASADRHSHPVQPAAPGNAICREAFAQNGATKALTLWPGCGGCRGAGLSWSCSDMGVGAVGSPSRHSPSGLSAVIFPLML